MWGKWQAGRSSRRPSTVDQSAVTHVVDRAQWMDGDCHPGLRLRLRIILLDSKDRYRRRVHCVRSIGRGAIE